MEYAIAGLLFAIVCGMFGICRLLDKIYVEISTIRKMQEHDFEKRFD
jgi:hypothetical protein